MSIIITCVLLHFRRKSKSCQFASRIIILKIFSCCCDTNCCRCTDNFQIRIFLKKSCCLVCRFLRFVITISNLYQFQFAVFVIAFHNGFHCIDPCILVSSLGSSRKNCPLSFSTGDIKNCIQKSLSNLFCTSLVYEYLTAVFIWCGVERGYFDSSIHSFFQFSLKSINVICRDADCIRFLGNQVIQNFDLSISCCSFRINNIYCATFCLYSFLKRVCCDLKECVTSGFTNQCDFFAVCCSTVCHYRCSCCENHCSTKNCAY